MTKSHEELGDFDYLNDPDYIYQKLLEASRVPKEYFGKDDDEYYKKLIEEEDLIKEHKKEILGEPCTEEDLFRQILEDEREESVNPEVWERIKEELKKNENENRDPKK